MKQLVLFQVITGLLLTVSWGGEPPNEPPTDAEKRFYIAKEK